METCTRYSPVLSSCRCDKRVDISLFPRPSCLLESIGNHPDLLQIQSLLKQKFNLIHQPRPRVDLSPKSATITPRDGKPSSSKTHNDETASRTPATPSIPYVPVNTPISRQNGRGVPSLHAHTLDEKDDNLSALVDDGGHKFHRVI